MKELNPPQFLYHETSDKNLSNILDTDIKKMSRLHVHLSSDFKTALQVGSRHGNPVILKVNTGRMHKDGYNFIYLKMVYG